MRTIATSVRALTIFQKEFPMTTNALTVAQKLALARRKVVLALGLMVLYTLGMIHPANAQEEVTYITFDPPGSTFTQANSINGKGAVTGYYYKGNKLNHSYGFVRSRDGTITTFDPPGAKYTTPQSMNRAGVITGT